MLRSETYDGEKTLAVWIYCFEADFASDDAHSVKPARSFANSKELVSADFFSLQAIRMLK